MSKKEAKDSAGGEQEPAQASENLISLYTDPHLHYLTNYRNGHSRTITQLGRHVQELTGLSVKDFDLLVSLGVFNSALMNDAVWFKRYEDASCATGINRHEGEDIGL